MKVKINPVIPRLFFTSAISTSHGSSSRGPGCDVASFDFFAVEVEVGDVSFVDFVKLVGSASVSCVGSGSTSPRARSAASSEASRLREREADRECECERECETSLLSPPSIGLVSVDADCKVVLGDTGTAGTSHCATSFCSRTSRRMSRSTAQIMMVKTKGACHPRPEYRAPPIGGACGIVRQFGRSNRQ
jgi:hypothetical protein